MRKNVIEYKIFILTFSTTFSETFLILRRIEQDMIIKMYIGFNIRYLLISLDFNKTYIFSTDFRKIFRYQM